MDTFLGVIVGLIVLMVLVTLHELGHFIMARRNGVKVLEFGICFPPRAIAWVKDPETKKWKRLPRSEWGKPQKGLIFSLNWLPIGGFCQMDGESDADTRKGTFGAASYWAKTKILFGGVMMNWLTAIVIFTILAWTGMPKLVGEGQFTIPIDTRTERAPIEVTMVVEGSPAEAAGLQVGDQILSVDEQEIREISALKAYNNNHAGETVNYKLKRGDSEAFEATVQMNPEGSDYLIGIAMEEHEASYSTWSAPIVGVGLTAQLTGETFKGLGTLIWNLITGVGSQLSFDSSVREHGRESLQSVGDSVTGPVGIIGVLFPNSTAEGPAYLAFVAAIISVSLACMNVLPIPALDGGRWTLITIYKLRKKKLTKEIEEKIVARAMIVLLGLMVLVTILDVVRIAK
ncbi:site-2 protease family protein [Candidatus Saccharibacteria bacterium]|nr:site-2 protease family protein [Candidatus Saccharibacteria bacterium]